MMKKLNSFLLIAFSLLLVSCVSNKKGARLGGSFEQTGYASWYGEPFHGRKTASGEVYDMNQLTAAHPSLPFGTKLRVLRLDTQKSVVVRVNDRGPFKKGRIIDLSAAAAKILSIDQSGVAMVKIEKATVSSQARKRKKHPESYYLQVASYKNAKHAKTYAEYVGLIQGKKNTQVAYLNQSHKVWVGPLFSSKQLEMTRNQLKNNGIESVILRRS